MRFGVEHCVCLGGLDQGMVCGRTFKQPVTGNYVHPQHVDDTGQISLQSKLCELTP
jgi:hypothetical protein